METEIFDFRFSVRKELRKLEKKSNVPEAFTLDIYVDGSAMHNQIFSFLCHSVEDFRALMVEHIKRGGLL